MLIARAVFKEEHTAFLLSLRCHLIWYISFFSDFGPNFRHKNVHIFGTTLTALKIQTDLCLADGVLSENTTIWLLGVLENCMWHCYSGLTTWDYDRNRRKQTHTLGTSELAAPLQLTTNQSKTKLGTSLMRLAGNWAHVRCISLRNPRYGHLSSSWICFQKNVEEGSVDSPLRSCQLVRQKTAKR